MKRLWVQISLVIVLVTITITLFPLVSRQLDLFSGLSKAASLSALTESERRLSVEEATRIEAEVGNRVWRRTWYSIAFGAVVGLGVGIWLSRSLTKPLTALAQGAKAVAARDLDYRVPEKGSQEMQAVAHAFNDMAAVFKASTNSAT